METNKKDSGQKKNDGLLIFAILVLPIIAVGMITISFIGTLIATGWWIPIAIFVALFLLFLAFGGNEHKSYRPGDKEFEDKELY